MFLIPVDHGIFETLAVWGAEGEDVEDDDPAEGNGAPEDECEDEGAQCDDEGFEEVAQARESSAA